MICQLCGKKNATTHIKTVINGELTEKYFCEDCAKASGYVGAVSDIDFGFGSFLGGFFDPLREKSSEQRCEMCGASFNEISLSGKIGCPQCYDTFYRKLIPVIQRIHGTAQHKGKTPGSSALVIQSSDNQMVPVSSSALEEKKKQLKDAVESQNYERAAVLRDEIREMEKNG